MSNFDPDTFMSQTTEESCETTYKPIPEGDYQAVITKVEGRNPKGNAILDVHWGIDDPSLGAELGIENPTVRQSVFLDVNDQGALMTGANKNVQLGRLRDAVNQNAPGQPWAPSMLEGQVARISVKHRIDGENIYSDVRGVARVA